MLVIFAGIDTELSGDACPSRLIIMASATLQDPLMTPVVVFFLLIFLYGIVKVFVIGFSG